MRRETTLRLDRHGGDPPETSPGRSGGMHCIPGTPTGVRGFLEQLDSRLEPLGTDPDLRDRLEIVLAEVLNNVVEHAYRDRTDGQIELTMASHRTTLIVEIVDDGIPMPGNCLPEKRAADLDVPRDELPEGGFGWFLIHELVEELIYFRRDGRNHVRIAMRPD